MPQMQLTGPQTWDDECMAVDFIQLLRMSSHQTFQSKIVAYRSGLSPLERTETRPVSISDLLPDFLTFSSS